MGDSYVECLVSRDRDDKYYYGKIAMFVLGGACILGAFVTISLLFVIGIVLIVIGVIIPNPDYEYEYLFIGKELSIDKIIAKQKRKTVANYDLSKLEIMCPINSHELDRYKANNTSIKKYDSGKADSRPYVIVYRDEKGEILFSIEPNAELLKAIKTVCPRKVVEY